LPIQIFSFTVGSVIRPDLYALGTATTAVALVAVLVGVVFAGIRLRRRDSSVDLETQGKEELGEVPGGDDAGLVPRALAGLQAPSNTSGSGLTLTGAATPRTLGCTTTIQEVSAPCQR